MRRLPRASVQTLRCASMRAHLLLLVSFANVIMHRVLMRRCLCMYMVGGLCCRMAARSMVLCSAACLHCKCIGLQRETAVPQVFSVSLM